MKMKRFHEFASDIWKPLDKVRRSILWTLSPAIQPLIQNRELRVCVTACLGIIVAFSVTISFPMWQLLLGPILLGIPHVICDIRYLVLKDRLYKHDWIWFAVGLPFLFYFLTNQVFFATFAILLMSTKTRRKGFQRWFVQIFSLTLFAISIQWPKLFLYAFLHMHNLIGIGIWWFWRKNRNAWEYIPLVLIVLGTIGILLLNPHHTNALLYYPASMDVGYYGKLIAGFTTGDLQVSFVLLFAFLQSIHYLVWIRLIPEEDRKQRTPRGFQKSYKALQDDFGFWFLWGSFFALMFFIGYAIYSPSMARTDYLALISFHGFLELVMLVYQKQEKNDELDNGLLNNTSC
jgi:hypothetical protein